MKILDTSTINYILKNNLLLKDDFYVTPDVSEESEMVELVVGKKLPPKILEASKDKSFPMPIYLKCYKEMLNKYRGRSFYNMTGFGDISILAFLKTLIEKTNNQLQAALPGMEERLIVYTQDNGLMNRIKKEFGQYISSGRIQIDGNIK